MHRGFFQWLVGIVLTGIVAMSVAPASFAQDTTDKASPKQPHLLIFLGDDFSFLDSEAEGAKDVQTPSLTRLAKEGMTFSHAFVASPSCAPSRAALLTGLMPARNGAEINHARPRAELKKLPAYLQELGYEVVAFGKVSHYKHTAEYGFDKFSHDTFHNHDGIPAAIQFLKDRKDGDHATKPLCIFVGSNWPHVPWPRPAPDVDLSKAVLDPSQADTPETRKARIAYTAAVKLMDDELGRVMDAAKKTLGSDNLVTLMSSDHGAQFPFAKWNCYDAGTRVPFIVSWPGVIAPNSRVDAMVSWVDILPTLVDLGGGKPDETLDGKSIVPVLKGETKTFRERIFTTHSSDGKINNYPMRSIRTQDWKLILNLTPEAKFTTHIDLEPNAGKPRYWGGYWKTWQEAAETDPDIAAKVKRYYHRPAVELYDLKNDPYELNNLADVPEHAQRVKELRGELEAWMKQAP